MLYCLINGQICLYALCVLQTRLLVVSYTWKLLDSAIIGILCYFGMLLLDLPYPILISVIIGVTNVIPFFGPYIGAIPCILLILVVDPIKGLYFAIFILLLQQFDGNILGPKILGDSTGLSSFMVIVAIMIGGGLFGVPGMIAGVPVFAVLYALIWRLINHSLNDKKMPAEEETYINIDCLDEQTGEVLPLCKEEKHKVSPEELEARKNNFFMKIWESAFRTGHNHMEISLADFKHNMGIYQKSRDFPEEQIC